MPESLAYSTVKLIHHGSLDVSGTGEIYKDGLPLEEEQINLPKAYTEIFCDIYFFFKESKFRLKKIDNTITLK